MRILHKFRPALLTSLLFAFGMSGAAHAQVTITLPEALLAATKNIDAQIAKLQLEGARADIVAANRAPLPTLSTSVSQIDLQNGVGAGSILGEKRIDKNIGIDWTWERGEKRTLRTKAATEAANASAQDLSEALVQQRLIASNAFFDLYGAQERIRQVGAIEESAKLLAATASKRLAAGDLSAQDAARSNIEAQRAQNETLLAEQERARAERTLNLVLDLGQQKLTAIASGTHAIVPQAILDKGYSSTNAIEQRPDVQAALARTLTAKAQLDSALALQKNDITLGTAFDHFPGTSNRLLTFRMQMPLQLGVFGGYTFQGEIARASSQLAIAEAALDRARHAATLDVQRLVQERQSSALRAASYTQNIAPEAKRVADLAELAYNKGALSLTDLLEARRTWRATTLEAIAAQTDFEKAQTAWDIRFKPTL
jgi:outer membrane protein, heavy metal efflux system